MANHYQAPLQTTPNQSNFQANYTDNMILEKAIYRWSYILESSGINSSFLKNKHGPCPICGGKDRFRFDDLEGRGTYICTPDGAGCGAGDGFQLLQRYHGWTPKEAFEFLENLLGGGPEHISDILKRIPLIKNNLNKQENSENKRKKLNLVWSQSKIITSGDPVDIYLRSRGIILQFWPENLRYHSQLPYYDDEKKKVIGTFPAMIALVQDPNDKGITIHRTFLGDGCKANVPQPKKLMPPIMPGVLHGAAIRLYKPGDGVLAVAEGIETALAFNVATKIPIWATISAGGMEKIDLPQNIREVIIAVDNDQSGRGQEAASKLAKRLLIEGRTVRSVIPPNVGDDFADMLMRGVSNER